MSARSNVSQMDDVVPALGADPWRPPNLLDVHVEAPLRLDRATVRSSSPSRRSRLRCYSNSSTASMSCSRSTVTFDLGAAIAVERLSLAANRPRLSPIVTTNLATCANTHGLPNGQRDRKPLWRAHFLSHRCTGLLHRRFTAATCARRPARCPHDTRSPLVRGLIAHVRSRLRHARCEAAGSSHPVISCSARLIGSAFAPSSMQSLTQTFVVPNTRSRLVNRLLECALDQLSGSGGSHCCGPWPAARIGLNS